MAIGVIATAAAAEAASAAPPSVLDAAIARMVEDIVEINATATGGTVTEGDLLLRGYSRQQIDRHRGAALRRARPRLRDCAA
ncbi:hypothetical protein [Inquilinus sp. CA228]|uniref:hypothetical protein n=1 Tax=Inquilinus sp. CA228 TaxID=3455609 RepID=UPI003F8D4D94